MTLSAVILDSREPSWVHALDFGDVPTSEKPYPTLPAGDAWLATNDAVIIVERKTFSDLLGSIQDGRLFDQAARMVKLSPWCYLVVQGWASSQSGVFPTSFGGAWTVHRVEGALATVQQIGVVVVRVGPLRLDYHDALLWLASRKRGDVEIAAPRRKAAMQSPGERILCALPGISEVRARALLDHCATAAWALIYLTGEGGGKVHGVGVATKTAAKQALGLRDDAIFTINTKEKANE